MKIKTINYKKLLSTSLIALQLISFTGCAKPIEKENMEIVQPTFTSTIELVKEENNIEQNDNTIVIVTNEEIIEEQELEEVVHSETVVEPTIISEENNLDEFLTLLDSVPTIKELNDYYMEHFNEINNVLDENAYQIQLSYAASAYKKLKNTNLDSNIILNELNNLIIEQQLPRGMDDEEWQDNFGNIVTTLDPEQSLFDTYFCLAYMIHDHMCDEEHTINEFGATSCKTLVKEFKNKYEPQK